MCNIFPETYLQLLQTTRADEAASLVKALELCHDACQAPFLNLTLCCYVFLVIKVLFLSHMWRQLKQLDY